MLIRRPAGIWFTKAGTMRHFSVMAVPRQKTLISTKKSIRTGNRKAPPPGTKMGFCFVVLAAPGVKKILPPI